jgi:hypothetical protein
MRFDHIKRQKVDSMHKMLPRGTAVIAAILLCLTFATAASSAGSLLAASTGSSSTTGSKATYTSGQHYIVVSDTKSDGHSAYVWWNPGTSHADRNRGETSGGNGTSIHVPVSTDGSGVISFQACRDVAGGPDNCGSWVTTAY